LKLVAGLAVGAASPLPLGAAPQSGPAAAERPASAASPAPLAAPGGALATTQARAKLQQARAQIGQGDFDRAEQLAREAEALGPALNKGEDTPRKVLDDVARARTDAKGLLTAARAALARRQLDRAEQLAKMADKASSVWTFPVWADNPAKVLKDVQAARAQPPAPKTEPAAKPVAAKAAPADKAGPAGDAQAREPKAPAAAGAEPKAAAAAAKDSAKPGPRKDPRTEAVTLVQKGREQLAAGKIEEATQSALRAKALDVRWGLFEDTPDSLQKDVDRARAKRDRDESTKVLAEGRKLYEQGSYEEATRAAYRAQRLHGPYSVWELGDRPDRLLADVQAAKLRKRKEGATEVARKDAPKAAPADKKPGATAVAEGPAGDPAQARKLLVDARAALQKGDTTRARELADQVKKMNVALNRPGDDSPEAVYRDLDMMARARGGAAAVAARPAADPGVVRAGAVVPPGPAVPPADPDQSKARAQALLAEARQLQAADRLAEARQRIAEARALNAPFAADEESPEQAALQLAARARRQADALVRQAVQEAASADPGGRQKAEATLGQARQLCATFGLDAQPVDAKLAWLHGLGGPALPQAGGPAVEAPGGAAGPGEGLLKKARLELRSGDTGTARKTAEEACKPQYGVRDEALSVLRSIDAEEFNQRRLQANRVFDAAESAYNRGEYAAAANLIGTIDTRNLDPARRDRLKNITMTAEMRPSATGPVAQAKAESGPGAPALPERPAGSPAPAGDEPAGVAHAGDKPAEPTPLDKTLAMRQVVFTKMRAEGLEVQRSAAEKFRTGQTDAALDQLNDYLARLNDAELDPSQVNLLRRPVEARLEQFKLLKSQRDFLAQDAKNAQKHTVIADKRRAEDEKNKRVTELLKQFNTLYREAKYDEAGRVAMLAHELDPDNPIATTAITIAKRQSRVSEVNKESDENEQYGYDVLHDSMRLGSSRALREGVDFDKDRWERAKGRKPLTAIRAHVGEPDRVLEHKLSLPVNMNFKEATLYDVLNDLRAWQQVNIVVDEQALAEENISLSQTVTIQLEQVSLKTALGLMLANLRLTYVVKDGVIQVTTPAHAKGKQVTVTYQVADLVIPIENFGPPPSPFADGTAAARAAASAPPTPLSAPNTLTAGAPAGSPAGPLAAAGANEAKVTKQGPTATTEESLIRLITQTVAPQSWSDAGGPGTIEYFPLTMALVINQTPDIQEQIGDLLAALRRLQDQEVTIEIRFISVTDSFFERIGVDFNLNIVTDHQTQRLEPLITTGGFTPDGFINNFNPGRFIGGLQNGQGLFTPTLDIPIRQQTYTQAFPSFGGYNGIPGYGGLTMGLAFLSQIQVFLFLEAVQGDVRTNIMQAPKLTLFNGQTSTLTVSDSQQFLTNLQVTTQLGQLVYTPTMSQIPQGVNLTMNAVITADRRFVRMSLSPNLTNIAAPIVNLVPIVTPIFPVEFSNGNGGSTGQPIVFTNFLQQPVVSTVSVQTTVMVPDGGTVLMGGIKRLSEERNEYGPPILSKIDKLNRLFKNTSYGRDAESLLIMVTPRIIIQEEEEERQTGVRAPAGTGNP
jgi:type II secretory pathway component GspD/PulD (secretin)